MFDLRVLGPPSITSSNGRSVEALGRQPRRVALLAYLAVAGASTRRDKLLALFWPESDEARARASLNQSLYVLRRVLGDDAILSSGTGELTLNHQVVACDVVAFEEALAAGRTEEALALYRGDLLDGFFVSGAPDFERWVDEERARLTQRAADAAWSLAETNADTGRVIEAERWARKAADLLPTDEAVVRRLMTFLNGLGDRAAAIRAYEAYVWRLAQEYELRPSADTESLAAAIRREQAAESTPTAPLLPDMSRRPVQRVVRPGLRFARPVAAIAVIALSVIVAINVFRTPSLPAAPLSRFALNFAGQPALGGGIGGNTIALSPDGDHLVYLGEGSEGDQLFLRPMSGLDAMPIPHTRGARHPFFSPDGNWLGFVVGNAIRKVRIDGGPAVTIATVATNVPGTSWGDNDVIVFATPSGLWQVPASGGEPTALALSDTAHGERFRWPDVLPGGGAVVFTKVDSTGFHLAVVKSADRAVIPLSVDGTHPHFVEPDHLVYGRPDGVVLRARFDSRTLRITSEPLPITEGVYVGIAGAAKLGVSRTGALAFVPEFRAGQLVMVDRYGRADTLRIGTHRFHSPRFSPDGEFIVTSILTADGAQDLWLVDLARATMRQITFDGGSVEPIWSPDGRRIVYSRRPAGGFFGFEITQIGVDGTQGPEPLVPAADRQLPGGITPDGELLVFERRDAATGRDVWVSSLAGRRAARPYLNRPSNESAPAVSPDGHWLAFVSDESGRDEVYVVSFPRPGAPVQVSFEGGRRPRWASGRELIYRTTSGFTAVTLETTPPMLQVVSHRPLFASADAAVPGGEAYGVHPDGNRLVIVRSAPRAGDVMVLLNWFTSLRTGAEVWIKGRPQLAQGGEAPKTTH